MLYQVTFDGQHDYVEARSFGDAVSVWHLGMKRENGPDWCGDEQPEQVVLISEKRVWRDEYFEMTTKDPTP